MDALRFQLFQSLLEIDSCGFKVTCLVGENTELVQWSWIPSGDLPGQGQILDGVTNQVQARVFHSGINERHMASWHQSRRCTIRCKSSVTVVLNG